MKQNRTLSYDILRIIAAFSVIMIHATACWIAYLPVESGSFAAADFWNSINRFGVPIFTMISGAMFLDPAREISLKKLWLHNILRLFVIYLVWSYLFFAAQSIVLWKFDFLHCGLSRTVTGIVYASDHLWYLPMIMGLYALTPVLRGWMRNASKREVEYLLALFVVFQILRVTAQLLLHRSLTDRISGLVEITELTGYLGYFVLGAYLAQYGLPRRVKRFLYASLPVDIAGNFLTSWRMSLAEERFNAGIFDSFGLLTFFEVAALFVFVHDRWGACKADSGWSRLLSNVAKDTLGIYVGHVLITGYLIEVGFPWATGSAVIGPPLLALVLFAAFALLAGILRRIPFVGKYLA